MKTIRLKDLQHGEKIEIKLGKGYTLKIQGIVYQNEHYFDYEVYLNGKYFTNLTNYICYDENEIEDDDTLEVVKQKVYKYLNNKYVGVNDLQGADFKIGDSMTLKEWKDWAIEDRDICDDDYGYRLMKKTPLKSIIDLIQDYWGIEIKKVVLG